MVKIKRSSLVPMLSFVSIAAFLAVACARPQSMAQETNQSASKSVPQAENAAQSSQIANLRAIEMPSGGSLMVYSEKDANTVCYIQPTEELKAKLSPEEYSILVEAATEPPFDNAFWDNHRAGIYIDKIDGTPLFASTAKFESGTGWPSFWQPIDEKALILVDDYSFGMHRIEVRARASGGHLGHLFDDGPKPTGLRYCINSASLRFIAREDMEKEGYGSLLTIIK
ncbi:MAG: peptide-methionine (R)-S-oxide reductase MsrB [Rectinema subterraneum]|uniref:peptide-methionine (R)-S-oxide reductase MsrB n=1 Tax=Rectinema subterraneum TaxID=2653714 RepID=UPI003C7E2009